MAQSLIFNIEVNTKKTNDGLEVVQKNVDEVGTRAERASGIAGTSFTRLGLKMLGLGSVIGAIVKMFQSADTLLKEQSEDGKGLTDVFKELFTSLSQVLVPVLQVIKDVLQKLQPMFEKTFKVLADIVANILKPLLPLLNKITSQFENAFNGELIESIIPIIQEVMNVINMLVTALTPLMDALQDIGKIFLADMIEKFKIIANVITALKPLIVAISVVFEILGRVLAVLVYTLEGVYYALEGVFKAMTLNFGGAASSFAKSADAFNKAGEQFTAPLESLNGGQQYEKGLGNKDKINRDELDEYGNNVTTQNMNQLEDLEN
jgi:hypothetical protein